MIQPRLSYQPIGCLREHLRNIVLHFHRRIPPDHPPESKRSFFANSRLRQEATLQAEPETASLTRGRDIRWHHMHPNGRIIGRPGRRQRQSSERLVTNALGRPAEVIVMRDVLDETSREARRQTEDFISRATETWPSTDADATSGVLSVGVTSPVQAEVDASIDSLRPDAAALEQYEYDELKHKMLQRYNWKQMAGYLLRSVIQAGTEVPETERPNVEAVQMRMTSWRPGRTPLDQRLGRVTLKKNDVGRSKARLAEQILRSAWKLTVQAEEQQLGELELYATSWQIKLLFDTKFNSQIQLERVIDSPLLLRSCDVRQFRPENIIRVTGRKADALDVAHRILHGLAQVRRDAMPLTAFKSMLGKHGWPDKLAKLFSAEHLQHVSERTASVIQYEDEGAVLAVYSLRERSSLTSQARRLLLSLLELPSPVQILSITPNRKNRHARMSVLDFETSYGHQTPNSSDLHVTGLHQRLQKAGLRRFCTRLPQGQLRRRLRPGDAKWSRLTRRLATRLEHARRSKLVLSAESPTPHTSTLGWVPGANNESWVARVGACVHFTNTVKRLDMRNGPAAKLTRVARLVPFDNFLDAVPGLQTVLARFKPAVYEQTDVPAEAALREGLTDVGKGPLNHQRRVVEERETQLLVHLMPSPFTKGGASVLERLPRLELAFNVHDGRQDGHFGCRALKLDGASLHVSDQLMPVPFPDHAADLLYKRSNRLVLSDTELTEDEHLRSFVERLQASYGEGTGSLDALPELTFKLPPVLTDKPSSARGRQSNAEGVEAQYLLDRFEQVQVMDFEPLKERKRLDAMVPMARKKVEDWPDDIVLRLRDVDAGAFGGRRTEVVLVPRAPERSDEAIVNPGGAAVPDTISGPPESSPATGDEHKPRVVKREVAEREAGGRAAESYELRLTRAAMILLDALTEANSASSRTFGP
ncbi:hypothetical protein BAUCODRAFT_176000 [Baudoinia panamericana UAMH 10762]|uniref:Uncharacterized protein n=1 Tax=Baudoinia panamericana (strain UAMH 10762) TaxID=717646 RepID=M2NM95_BAUPA|nr:uncharacterized protein BAUCODRAFT_176000 [Baudoinia panamericana UAMH 10762]EMD00630.1 hypothetical protein BAUCODRAFT_176000 [Baudoinia panamericana UAMH 10762]